MKKKTYVIFLNDIKCMGRFYIKKKHKISLNIIDIGNFVNFNKFT